MDLYKLPKDILVKLISTIREDTKEDIKKKKIFTVLMRNETGGSTENYFICADNIDYIYLHFFNLLKERYILIEENSKNLPKNNLEINHCWNIIEDEEKYFLTGEDLDFELGKYRILNSKCKSYTDDTVNILIFWYCKKFKIKLFQITVDHIKDIFENYSINWMDGLYREESKHSYIY